ncbi:MAG: hypothetical protein ACK5HT_08205, partial [Draconibacterium sp.]
AFVITDSYGIKYYFEDIETSNPWILGCGEYNHLSLTETAWYLSKVVHPTGETINFRYKRTFLYYDSGVTESYGRDNQYNCETCPGNPATFSDCKVQIRTSTIYLDSIFTDNELIVFKSTNNRLDLGGYKLDSIIVLDNSTFKKVKTVVFGYEFPKNSNVSGSSPNDYRMVLVNFQELNPVNSKRLFSYSFGYNDYTSLPSRLSFSQDHWGFFNGKSNSKFCPITAYEKNLGVYTSGNSYSSVWDAFPDLRFVDREADSLYTSKGILNYISFPTGSYIQVDYEPNSSTDLLQAGGVRVKRISTKQGMSTVPIAVERYYYSGGQGGFLPKYFSQRYAHGDTDSNPSCGPHDVGNCIYYLLSSNSNYTLFSGGLNTVVYSKVTKGYGENFENGSEENTFLVMPWNSTGSIFNIASRIDDGVSESEVLYKAPYINYCDYGGQLIQRRILAPDGQTVLQREEFEYNGERMYYPLSDTDLRNGKDIPAYHIHKCFSYNFTQNEGSYSALPSNSPLFLNHQCTLEDTQNSNHPCSGKAVGSNIRVKGISEYDVVRYNIVSRWTYLKRKVITQYDNRGEKPLTTETHYFYENEDHTQLTKKSTENSLSQTLENTFRYPSDINTGIYAEMTGINLLNYPIEETTRVNGNVVNSMLTTYKMDEGNYVADRTYILEPELPLSSSSFSEFNGTAIDPSYGDDPEVTYLDYNARGRLIKALSKDGIYIYYLWAYNNQYPIAKIESSKSDLSISPIQANINNLTLSGTNEKSSIDTDLEKIKDKLTDDVLSSNYVSLYTYQTLVGMTSETEHAGRTT